MLFFVIWCFISFVLACYFTLLNYLNCFALHSDAGSQLLDYYFVRWRIVKDVGFVVGIKISDLSFHSFANFLINCDRNVVSVTLIDI
jgi:hypothetical protein